MRHRKDYFKTRRVGGLGKRRFQNPFFASKKTFTPRKSWGLYKLIGLAVIVLAIYIFLFSPLFRIDNVVVNGVDQINTQEIEQITYDHLSSRRLFIIPQKNYFLSSTKLLHKKIEAEFSLKNLEINKSRKTIEIGIEEKVTQIIWVSEDQYFYLDLDGVVIREIPIEELQTILTVLYPDQYAVPVPEEVVEPKEGSEEIPEPPQEPVIPKAPFPICVNEEGTSTSVGSNILTSKSIAMIVDVQDALLDKTQFEPRYYSFQTPTSTWLKVMTDKNVDLYFDFEQNVDDQVTNLLTVIDQNIEDLGAVEYIDLRFKDRVYFK